MNYPFLSIIMSVYNGEKYLPEAIESILTQTYSNFEFIIVNDGSKDNSLKIIKEFMQVDNRIILINQDNKGLPYSLNQAISKAKGKYIVRMDSDDISLPSRFYEQVKFMEENIDIGICGTWVESFGDNIKPHVIKYPSLNEEMRVRLLFSVCFAHPTVIIRKNIIDRYSLDYNHEFVNAQDYELWSRISRFTKMSNIPKVLLKYRISSNSITFVTKSKNSELRYTLLNKVFDKYINQLAIKNSEKENRLHFIIASNDRISETNINLNTLNSYLNKLLKANKKAKVFEQSFLEYYLAKKFLIVVYYKIKKKDLNFLCAALYGLFWKGSFLSILKRFKHEY